MEGIDESTEKLFFKPLFVYFCLFYMTQLKYKIDKSMFGVLETRTWGGRMEGTYESTELWWHTLHFL